METTKEARREEYAAKCARWAPLMQDVTPLEKAQEEARQCYGWNSKEYKAAKRALHNAKRANILAMCRTAFPGVKFSLTKHEGWGGDWDLTWEDGPSEKLFNEEVDLDLFSTYFDTFDGMTDCAGIEKLEFTDFATKYMGACSGGIEIKREMSDDKEAEIAAEVVKTIPELGKKNSCGYYARVAASGDVLNKLLHCYGYNPRWGDVTATEVAMQVWRKTDYYTRPETPKPTPAPRPAPDTNPGEVAIIKFGGKTECDFFAVTGDTKPIKDGLKELGGWWRKNLPCGSAWTFKPEQYKDVQTYLNTNNINIKPIILWKKKNQ